MGAMTAPSSPSPPDAVASTSPEDDLIGSSAAGPAALRGSVLRGGSYATSISRSSPPRS
jgi:hypothetical protein